MRVLIVDDYAGITEAAAELLSRMGHDCRIATCTTDAIAIAEEFEPELALFGIGLPDRSSYELAWELRTRLAPCPPYLVALTGWSEARTELLAAGFDNCLFKPSMSEQLGAVVELAQRRRRGCA